MHNSVISVTPSDSRIQKLVDSRIFFSISSEQIIWISSDLFLIRGEWFSSVELSQTPLVCELLKQTDFSSRFSSGVKQSSSEGSTKLHIPIPFFDSCWSVADDYCFGDGSYSFKGTSASDDVWVVVVNRGSLSSKGVE